LEPDLEASSSGPVRIWGVRAIDPGTGVVLEHDVAIEQGRITEVAEGTR